MDMNRSIVGSGFSGFEVATRSENMLQFEYFTLVQIVKWKPESATNFQDCLLLKATFDSNDSAYDFHSPSTSL